MSIETTIAYETYRTQIGSVLTHRIRKRLQRSGFHTPGMDGEQRNSNELSAVSSNATSSQTPLLARQDTHLSLDTIADANADIPARLQEQLSVLQFDDSSRRLHHSRTQELPRRFLAHFAASQRADAPIEEREAALVEALATGLARSDSVIEALRETEELWENQRGFVFFGRLKFSANARLPGDATQWTNSKQRCAHAVVSSGGKRLLRLHRPSPYTKNTVPLPDPRWEWSTTWLIDMKRPCDAQGWDYNWRYTQYGWHGHPKTRHSFVRRRRWVRERRRAAPMSTAAAQAPDQTVELKNAMSPATGMPGTALYRPPSDCEPEQSEKPEPEPPHNSAFADPQTPHAVLLTRISAGPPPTADTLLPAISSERALELLSWEQALPTRWPFTAFARVKEEAEREAHQDYLSRSGAEMHGAWREAVIDCNFRRVARVLGACRLDRERASFWRLWMEGPPEGEEGDMEDVWDLLESRVRHLRRAW